MNIAETKAEALQKMGRALESYQEKLTSIRTGRPMPQMISKIKANYYGTLTPIDQLGTVKTEGARHLVVEVWDQEAVAAIETAIIDANIGLNPQSEAKLLRMMVPQMTEETRLEMVKRAKVEAEQAKIAVRNIRRDANNKLRKAEKDGEISSEDEKRTESDIDKLTAEHTAQIDKVLEVKQQDLLPS